MNIFLWILAFALAAVFVASGAMKTFVPRDQTGNGTVLVPLAAAGPAITMVFAALVHIRRGDPTRATIPSILLAIGSVVVVVAWSRFGPYPL